MDSTFTATAAAPPTEPSLVCAFWRSWAPEPFRLRLFDLFFAARLPAPESMESTCLSALPAPPFLPALPFTPPDTPAVAFTPWVAFKTADTVTALSSAALRTLSPSRACASSWITVTANAPPRATLPPPVLASAVMSWAAVFSAEISTAFAFRLSPPILPRYALAPEPNTSTPITGVTPVSAFAPALALTLSLLLLTASSFTLPPFTVTVAPSCTPAATSALETFTATPEPTPVSPACFAPAALPMVSRPWLPSAVISIFFAVTAASFFTSARVSNESTCTPKPPARPVTALV